MTPATRIDWSNVPRVTVYLPHCPFCRGTRPIWIRTEASGDGTKTQKAICRICSRPFKIFHDLPPGGNLDFDPGYYSGDDDNES
jgi:hypothetical protein